MMIGNSNEGLRVQLQEGDPDLVQSVFTDVLEPPASDDEELAVTQEPTVLINLQWIKMLYNVLYAVL